MISAECAKNSFDPNGNRTGKSDAEGLTQYQYNYDNLLSELIDAEGNTTAYTFDAFNRRTAKLTGKANDDTRYLYDGINVLQEISGPQQQQIAAYYRANDMIVTRQEYNLGGDNDSLNRPEEGRSFYAYDGLGSVAALTNHQGNRKTRYQYDAFGKVIEGDLSQNPYAFTGKRFDTESGFYHFHFRKYDPETGVWTTPDPIGILGGLNLYRYVRNNPIRFVDRLGLFDDNDAAEADANPQGDPDTDSGESNPEGYGSEDTSDDWDAINAEIQKSVCMDECELEYDELLGFLLDEYVTQARVGWGTSTNDPVGAQIAGHVAFGVGVGIAERERDECNEECNSEGNRGDCSD